MMGLRPPLITSVLVHVFDVKRCSLYIAEIGKQVPELVVLFNCMYCFNFL